MLGKDRGRSAHHSGDLQEDFPEEVTFEPGPTKQIEEFFSQARLEAHFRQEEHGMFISRGRTQFVWRSGDNAMCLGHGPCHQGGVEVQERSLSQGLRVWFYCAECGYSQGGLC